MVRRAKLTGGNTNKARAESGAEETRASKSGLRVGLQKERRQGSEGLGNGEVAKEKAGVQTPRAPCSSQRPPKSMCAVE